MRQIDPNLMRLFRDKACNPKCFARVYKILRSYRRQDLKSRERAYEMIDRLSACCACEVSQEVRDSAADWLMNCDVDPQNHTHQRDMWNMIKGRRVSFWF